MVMEKEALFHDLPQAKQASIQEKYNTIQKSAGPSLLSQVGRLFFVETSSFALAWIFFSVLICFLLLFNIEGAKTVVWILPLLVVGFAYFLYTSPPPQRVGLFPTEHYVRENYLNGEEEGLSPREQLLQGWHLYLIHEWAHVTPSDDPVVFEQQLDHGLFAFNIARLEWIAEGKGDEVVQAAFSSPPSLLRVFSYFLWNLLFAWLINRREKHAPSELLSNPT